MHAKDTSEPAGSWGRFAGRMYFLGERNPPSSAQLVSHRKDTFWCYIITSVIYFFLISVILIILLLAPKYRISSQQASPVNSNMSSPDQGQTHAETQSGTGKGTVVEYNGNGNGKGKNDIEDEDDTITESKEEEFLASPKDPLYIDIDPRSSFEEKYISGEKGMGDGESRARTNSKFNGN